MISRSNGSRKTLMMTVGVGLVLVAREMLRRWRETDLRGEVVLVTGGSRGLGFLLAREFAHEGCRIAICARNEQELERAKRDLEALGAEVLTVKCDIADQQQVERMVQEVTRRFRRLDVLVNNAGIIQVGPVEAMTLDDFEQAMDIMFWGALYPTMAVLPQMLQRKRGRIVNITSIGGKIAIPHLLPYDCAKFAAVGLSEGLHAELAKHNIVVTTVVPGLMRTGSFLNAFFKGRRKREFTWFSLGSTLPFFSMDAEVAAQQIVAATKRGASEIILSLPANIVVRFHGLFPGLMTDLFGLFNRFLPSPNGAVNLESGMKVHDELHSKILDALTQLGLSAANRFHQYPEASSVKIER